MKNDLINGIYCNAIKIQEDFENNEYKNMTKDCKELCAKYGALKSEEKYIKPPNDQSLPFFAYGIFKPGQLSYSKIKDYVSDSQECDIPHEMRYRDGIPLIFNDESDRGYKTRGFLINFKDEKDSKDAYSVICKSEPDKLYFWRKSPVLANGKLANVLIGRSPEKGSYIDRSKGKIGIYDGKEDPFFFRSY